MILTVIVSVVTCVGLVASVLAFPKLKIKKLNINTYWVVGLVGALVIIATGCIFPKELFEGLTKTDGINPVKILLLFISMTFLSVFLDEEGFFGYLAEYASKKAKTSQVKLFFIFYAVVSVLTVFTSNDIVILTFTPFICYFAKHTKISPVPYLVAEFAAANTWSMLLIIGNPTNVYIATSVGISFIDYVKTMALPTLFAGVAQIVVIFLLFKKQLSASLISDDEHVEIKDLPSLVIGVVHLLSCLVLLVISSYAEVEMWLICVFTAVSLIIFVLGRLILGHKPLKPLVNTARRLPWDLIPFVLSMFVLVLALKKHGATDYLFKALASTTTSGTILKFGVSSYLACNLINNIPMSVLFSTFAQSGGVGAVYATVIGSNVGAFLTPVGALAGIMFTDLIRKDGVEYGFKAFVKYGIIISVPTLFSALCGLMLVV